MIRLKFVYKGSEKIRKNLKALREGMPKEVMQALYTETEIEVTEVKRRTPVDTGNLRASVHQHGPFRDGRQVYTMIVAGGVAAPYAVYVHENLDAFHKVGEAKFIESVILESRPHMMARVANRISLQRAMQGG